MAQFPSVMPSQGQMPIQGQQMPPTGLYGAEQALQGGLNGALAGLQSGINTGRTDIAQGQRDITNIVNRGVSALQPLVDSGRNSNALQAALSGAMGPQAQQQAYNNFQSSPGQQFLQERGEQAVTRNAAATGGLQGGRVLQELQRQGMGLAQQDFANSFDRLGQLAGQGLQANNMQTSLFNNQAGLAGQAAGQMGQLGLAGGQAAGQFAFDTGQLLAGGRTRVGEQMASAAADTSSILSQLINQQGQGLVDIASSGSGNLAQLLQGAGQMQGQDQQALAALLAQISMQQGQQAAGLPQLPGGTAQQGQAAGLGPLVQGAGQAGAAMMASDIRLKENIRLIGQTPGGHNLYTWDWNEIGKRVAFVGQPGLGVIAQEVAVILPEAIFTGVGGYLHVDYARLN